MKEKNYHKIYDKVSSFITKFNLDGKLIKEEFIKGSAKHLGRISMATIFVVPVGLSLNYFWQKRQEDKESLNSLRKLVIKQTRYVQKARVKHFSIRSKINLVNDMSDNKIFNDLRKLDQEILSQKPFIENIKRQLNLIRPTPIFAQSLRKTVNILRAECDSMEKDLQEISDARIVLSHVKSKNYDLALSFLNKKLNKNPYDRIPLRVKSFILNNQEKSFEQTVEEFERIQHLEENDLSKEHKKLIIEQKIDLQALKNDIAFRHNAAYAYSRIADNLTNNDEKNITAKGVLYKKAEDVFHICIESSPSEIMPYFSMGYLMQRQKKYDLAKQFYKQSNHIKKNSQAYLGIASLALINEDLPKVCKSLKKAKKLRKKDRLIKYSLAKCNCDPQIKKSYDKSYLSPNDVMQNYRASFFHNIEQINVDAAVNNSRKAKNSS